MIPLGSKKLVEAVRLWTGWGQSIMPSRDDARIMNRYGDEATNLLHLIKSLENDFYASDARLIAANIEEMEELSSEHFKRKYPTAADEIVKALAWCYTFDFK